MRDSALRHRILIVEDDPAICDAYRIVLEQEGYEIVTAANGKDALAKLKNGAPLPHLILLDLMMPVMNGWEFLEARRADPALVGVPVVALTCGAGPVSLDDTKLVADKPMDILELATLVQQHCNGAINEAH